MSLVVVSTIKFNVGGRMFEVNRSLLQHFPETLLAKLSQEQDGDNDSNDFSSSNEMKAPSDDNEILFIDRDSERFACILNYMRDGKIDLPVNISKQSLLTDFAYYGFDAIDPDSIGTCWSFCETFSFLKYCQENFTTMMDNISSRKTLLVQETANSIEHINMEASYKIGQIKKRASHKIKEVASRKIKKLKNQEDSMYKQLEAKRRYYEFAYQCFQEHAKTLEKSAITCLHEPSYYDCSKELVTTNTELQGCFFEFGLEFLSAQLYPNTSTSTIMNQYFVYVVNFDHAKEATKVKVGKRCRK